MVRRVSIVPAVLASLAFVVANSPSDLNGAESSKAAFASATITPTKGYHCSGSVAFTQLGENVRVAIHLRGLNPGQKHAVHIYELGDCSAPDSLGEHYDPGNDDHGLPPKRRHAGDLGNVLANASGDAHYELTVSRFSVSSKRPIVGRAVTIRLNADDGSDPSGNAGPAIGCGVIQTR